MFGIKFGRANKPLTKKALAAMAIDRVKKDRVAFTHGMGYYRQVVIRLGERELVYYRPFLSELCQAIKQDLEAWYEKQKCAIKPQLLLVRGDDQTTVSGSFDTSAVAGVLAGGQS